VDPVPDPLLLRKSGSAGNRTRKNSYSGPKPEYLVEVIHIPKIRRWSAQVTTISVALAVNRIAHFDCSGMEPTAPYPKGTGGKLCVGGETAGA
jgi:hypothetical protein